ALSARGALGATGARGATRAGVRRQNGHGEGDERQAEPQPFYSSALDFTPPESLITNHPEGLRPSESPTRSLAGPRKPHSARVGSLARSFASRTGFKNESGWPPTGGPPARPPPLGGAPSRARSPRELF